MRIYAHLGHSKPDIPRIQIVMTVVLCELVLSTMLGALKNWCRCHVCVGPKRA